MHLHDAVELTHDIDHWAAGTAAVVVDEHDRGLMVEIVGPDGATLELLAVAFDDVRQSRTTCAPKAAKAEADERV